MVEASHSPRSLRAAQSLLSILPSTPSPLNPGTAARKRVVATPIPLSHTLPVSTPSGAVPILAPRAPTTTPLRPATVQRAMVVAPPAHFQLPPQQPLQPVTPAAAAAAQQGGSLHMKQGWTGDEDATIMQLVEQIGQKWSTISAALPGRTDDAVRNRYLRLQRKRKHEGGEGEGDKAGDMWTPGEDQLIMEAANKFGLKWHAIASAVPGRSANAVRNRFLRTWTASARENAQGQR